MQAQRRLELARRLGVSPDRWTCEPQDRETPLDGSATRAGIAIALFSGLSFVGFGLWVLYALVIA